ncbi:MAG: hypothetical protein HKM95_12000 [Inquilinus sp.]|nr:hypothetical protein [Inquilinus sp.]
MFSNKTPPAAIAVLLAANLGAPAGAAVDHAAEYAACLTLAARAPTEALDSARSWEELGGGNAARHCAASALFTLRRYEEAALAFDELAAEIGGVDRGLTASLYEQAGRAWLLAGETLEALTDFALAIGLDPERADYYVARAYAHAAREDYDSVLADLDRAAALDPAHPEVPVLRAGALRFRGELAAALGEAEQAVALAPGNPEAFLERGNIRWLQGDAAAAARDWHQAIALAPDSAAAGSARRNLARQP